MAIEKLVVEKKEKSDKHTLANPSKFGLAGFAIALFMLGLSFVDAIPMNTVVLATVLTMGVIAPLLAGILEYIKGNSFRATALILISLFFLSSYIFNTRVLNGVAQNGSSLGAFYLAWTLITAILLCGTIIRRMDAKMILLLIILAAFLLFVLLASIANFAAINGILIASGVFALICAAIILADFVMHVCARYAEK
jgi:hypothetical protein